MARGPRRLRNLNLEVQDPEPMQEGPENLSDNEDEENLEGPPDIDDVLASMPSKQATPIKIIWPNGEVRQVLGDFGVANLSKLNGGKVIVGTDENGVPNERSASILGQHLGDLAEIPTFAPLHIPRWDNDLFTKHKEQIIKDVELKFVFPRQTIQLTRDWILRTVNNRWRAYKSKLKKLYFNREERSLDQIIQGRPKTVNEHQWRSLVGLWCQEAHKKLCATNSRCAKLQKNAHTTGRKSHARLLKEMEDKKKGKVHRIELWDAAHKKKNGRYSTNRVKTIMDASFEELQKRKEQNNGNLSTKDFNEVFNEVVANQLKARGYYDNKYWSQVQVSQGIAFVTQTEEERRHQEKVNAMDNKIQRITIIMKQWLAFMSKMFPEMDCINEMESALRDEVGHAEMDGDDIEHACSSDNSHGAYSDNDIGLNPEDSNDNVCSPKNYVQPNISEESNANAYSRTNDVQHQQSSNQASKNFAQASLPLEQTTTKVAQIKNISQAEKGREGPSLPRDSIRSNLRSQRIKAPAHNQSESSQVEVDLISMRNKSKVVAKGKLVTTDSTRNIGGTVLGKEFVGVYVEDIENIGNGNNGDELLPRPFFGIETVKDAIGFVIAWPHSYVKRAKISTQRHKTLRDGSM